MKNDMEFAAVIKELMEAFFMRSLDGFKKHIKTSGLSLPQIHLLMYLHHGGCRGVHDIGSHLDVTSAAASQLIDKLVNAGFVERTENPDDRRGRRIALTEMGEKFVRNTEAERYRWIDDAVKDIDGKARKAILEAAPSLLEAVRKTDGKNQRERNTALPTSTDQERCEEC
jgi:DNA-binding MarR family transcriptional regulator